eukprot:TRINITY_DN3861_c0_g1_i2.p3 TRINITY_DN3861_c0_g1~~TRINITY_DN3861_c0_g1_i2.p3  ORF type:complete len:101 (+),score=27.21 TRINITY_DN3861_c0_g1_i2:65-367(+)
MVLRVFAWYFFFFFSSRRRHTRCREVSWARRCVQETDIFLVFTSPTNHLNCEKNSCYNSKAYHNQNKNIERNFAGFRRVVLYSFISCPTHVLCVLSLIHI